VFVLECYPHGYDVVGYHTRGGGEGLAHLCVLFRGAHQQLHHFTVVADQPSVAAAAAAAAACLVGFTDLVGFAQG